MNQDLTKGTPSVMIWRLCLPLFFGALVQQLYVVMDSLVAGRFIGETALAAIGNTYQITLLYQAIAFGVATGVSVVVSRRFGAGKGEEIRTATTTALITISLLCAVLTLVGLACCDALLKLIRTPENVFLPSKQYLQRYTIGLLPLFFYQITLGIFAALGDAKTPAIFLTISSLANIALDFLLVVRFQLGVSGIAWATLVCQAGSSAVSLMLLKKRLHTIQHNIHKEKQSRFSLPLLREMLKIALPVTLQQMIVSTGNILIQANVNSFGSSVSAGYAAAIKMNNMAIAALMAFDKGMASFSAQNSGANKTGRIRSGRNAAVLFSALFGISVAAVFLIFRTELLRFFLRAGSTEAMQTGGSFFLIVIPFYLFVSVKIACDGVLRGLGAMRELLIGTFVDLSLRVACGFLFSAIWGSVGIWAAWPVGWVTGTVLSAAFTSSVLRRKNLDVVSVPDTHT